MYGLIGKKLVHSFSASFFNDKFRKEGINETYKLLPIPDIDCLPGLIAENPDLKGLNVTIPYKEEVIPFLNYLSPDAREIGAVNVIQINRSGNEIELKGYNSDCIGFKNSLLPLLSPNFLQVKPKALILGTGGASKAVAYVLKNLGIEYTFVSRNPDAGQLSYADLKQECLKSHFLIVNTTPLGTYPDVDKFPPIPYDYLTPDHICYDLVYNPEETEFLKKSKERGATVKNGLEMLHLQALAAWVIWNS